MIKYIKRIFCKHNFVEINRYTNVVHNFSESREEEMIILYCPICDLQTVKEKHEYFIKNDADFKRREAKLEYLKSLEYKKNSHD